MVPNQPQQLCTTGLLFCHPSMVEMLVHETKVLGEADIRMYLSCMGTNTMNTMVSGRKNRRTVDHLRYIGGLPLCMNELKYTRLNASQDALRIVCIRMDANTSKHHKVY